jgi:hypothetical protein
MNLIEIIMKLLGSGDMVSKIASVLGVGQDQAGKAVGAAIPTILATIMGSASKPEGASKLFDLLGKQPAGGLDDLGGLLSQGAEQGVGESNPLTSLLGGSGLGQIAGVLSKFTGVGEGGIGKLLGMLAPVVLGVIGKQSKGMDVAGLAGLLAGQKNNLAAAMPPGLGNMLGSAIPGLGSVLGDTTSAATSAVKATSAAAGQAARQAETAASPLKKLLIPLILVGLAAFLLPKMCRKTADTAGTVAAAAGSAVDATAESARFTTDVSSLINDATAAVSTIKDEATATSALPKLREVNTKLAGLKSVWAKLPAPAQSIAGNTLRPIIASLREALQPVLALPVVGPMIKPAVDEMLGALDGFIPAA